MHASSSVGALVAGLLILGATGLGAATPPELLEPPIELPKYEVVDSRILPNPESWRYAEVPGFEVLSNISARETRRFMQDFVLLQEVIQTIMPVLVSGRSDVPTALILTGRGKGFAEFEPAQDEDAPFSKNSVFLQNAERTAIVVDFALTELQLADSTRLEADPYRAFYSQYFRYLIRRQIGTTAPAWLEEGLVQIFASIDFNRKWIDFGLVGDGFGGHKVGDFNELLARRALMPMNELFERTSNGEGAQLWGTQCYAFVHLCLYGNTKFQRPFVEFVSRLKDEPLSEDLFRRCFKMSYRDMGFELRSYIEMTIHHYVRFKSTTGQQLPAPPAVTVREATQAEIGRIKGEVLRLGGHDEAAHLAMIAPYIRGQKDPRLLAALGLDELQAGHEDRARKFLEAAAQEKAVRARAYLELGRLRYKEALAKSDNGRLSPQEVERVLAPLFTAATQPPHLAPVYETIADVCLHGASAPTNEQLAVLKSGVDVFPLNPNLLANVATLYARAGRSGDAAALAERGVKLFARDPAQKERFALLSEIVARDANATGAQKQPSNPVTP